MKCDTTRRAFMRRSAVAGSCLLWGGLPATRKLWGATPRPSHATQSTNGGEGRGGSAQGPFTPVTVITQPVSRDANPRAALWGYITEILQHAGLWFETLPPSDLSSLAKRPQAIILLAGDLPLAPAEREVLANLVNKGASLIGIGGTSGMDQVFGVASSRPLAEGWIKVTATEHPVTAGLRSSLHVFGGCLAKPASATSLATAEGASPRAPSGSAVLENRFGQGTTLLLGPDLIFSIAHIQQGLPVLQDAHPSPDHSAAVNEGILMAEDSLVLDWQRDRSPMQPDGGPVFLEPISDELRELIIRGVLHAARQHGIALPMLWYWPRGLKAIGHLSHDTDGNDPAKAGALLEVMNQCGVKTTWCIIYPGGYPREFYERLKEQGFEVALHYDAHSAGPETTWSKPNFLLQHTWLLEEAGLERIISNKNHYTRWEGRLAFYRWCEEVGILSDQTRGPSKKGAIGFPLGGSHPYFPLDDECDPPRHLDVLQVNMLTQDLVIRCPREYGRQLLDSAARHHGVAHFLFHPAHILKPGVGDAVRELVDYGRAQGLEWWTCDQIQQWERARRQVHARFDARPAAERVVRLHAKLPLQQATLLVLQTSDKVPSVAVNDQAVTSEAWTLYGFLFQSVTVELTGNVTLRIT